MHSNKPESAHAHTEEQQKQNHINTQLRNWNQEQSQSKHCQNYNSSKKQEAQTLWLPNCLAYYLKSLTAILKQMPEKWGRFDGATFADTLRDCDGVRERVTFQSPMPLFSGPQSQHLRIGNEFVCQQFWNCYSICRSKDDNPRVRRSLWGRPLICAHSHISWHFGVLRSDVQWQWPPACQWSPPACNSKELKDLCVESGVVIGAGG